MSVTEPKQTLRAVPLLVGVVLLAIYIRIGTAIGYQASYGPALRAGTQWDDAVGFHNTSQGEARFWIAHLIIALPAVMFMAYGLLPRLVPLFQRIVARIDRMTTREWRAAAVLLFALLLVWSAIGRKLVLLGLPITDDENAVRFGARMIAEGHLSVPILEPDGVFNQLFTYRRAGMVSSMDYPGVLLFDAAAVVVGAGDLLYALASAVAGVSVVYATGRWFGPRGRVLAAMIWCASPMVASLSLTAHAHVPSRMFVALSVAVAARLCTETTTPRRDAVLLGLFAGLGFMCRPLEVAAVLLPVGVLLTLRVVRKMGVPRSSIVLAAAGMLPSLAVFAWWNTQITGVWYLPARFSSDTLGTLTDHARSVGDRLGFNLGFNLLMLVIFFLGVPVIALVAAAFGRWRDAPVGAVAALGGGVALHLALCLAHDNTGIHSVGPIHVSESAVPLVIISVAGLTRGFAWLRMRDFSRTPAAVFLVAYLGGWCALFNITNLASLHKQAASQQEPFDVLDAAGAHNAVVVAMSYLRLMQVSDELAPWGSWVLEYPPPDPFFRDDRIFVRPAAPLEVLRTAFPEREIWILEYGRTNPSIKAVPLYRPPSASPL